MLKKLLILITSQLIFINSAYAESSSLNLAIPNAGNNYMYDKFRSGELDCSNAIGSASTLEFGVTGILQAGDPYYYDSLNNYINSGSRTGDIGVYARIIIPIGKVAKERINCNDLYQLELQAKRLEILKLERELEQLRALRFEN